MKNKDNEIKEIPWPKGVSLKTVNHKILYYVPDSTKPKEEWKQVVIGYDTGSRHMHPDRNFEHYFPDLWKQYFAEKPKIYVSELYAGMYVLSLGIGHKSRLYPILGEVFGSESANTIMDYSMYNVRYRCNESNSYSECMKDEVTFSDSVYTDSQCADVLSGALTSEKIAAFRDKWLDICVEKGITEAWICILGTEKSVNYMYAVSAKDGRPITYDLFEGSQIDSTVLRNMIQILSDHGIKTAGIGADRVFCTPETFELLRELGLSYIVVLSPDTYGYLSMFRKYGSAIAVMAKYTMRGNALFEISEKRKVFPQADEETSISFFFDIMDGSQKIAALFSTIYNEKTRLEKAIRSDENSITVSKGLEKYVDIRKQDDKMEVVFRFDEIQKTLDDSGFNAVACSEDIEKKQEKQAFHLITSSDNQYMLLKVIAGFSAIKKQYPEVDSTRFFLIFTTTCLRSEIEIACEKHNFDIGKMIEDTGIVLFNYKKDEQRYDYERNIRTDMWTLLGEFGILDAQLEAIVTQWNKRLFDNNTSDDPFRMNFPEIQESSAEMKSRRSPHSRHVNESANVVYNKKDRSKTKGKAGCTAKKRNKVKPAENIVEKSST